jgi:ATP-dependent RNA circularization protein (DNA/RNA ligase family)
MYERTGRSYALQGELIGEGIQGNPEKISGQRFYLFDVYDINEGRYLYADERTGFLALLAGYNIFHAPVLDTVVVTDKFSSIDEILAYAEGPSLNPSTPREGVVFKSLNSPFTFKAISNTYLLKNTDR